MSSTSSGSVTTMKILVVEDEPDIARIVKTGLEGAGYLVDVAPNATVGLDLVSQRDLAHAPYLAAVIDIMLPGVDGLSMIETLRKKLIDIPVLILSARRLVDDRIAGLQIGGDDYLTKPFALAELLARIQALLRRTARVNETTLTSADFILDLLSRELRDDNHKLELQPKEFSLLELLMRHPNQIVTKSQILKQVWNYNFDPQTNVVDVLVCRLRNRIQDEFHTKMIETVRGVGYVLRSA